ncbi:MAG: hypothetical protein AB1584_14335 [Pseudomonadota bacterium]
MQNQKQPKLFAFQLAGQREQQAQPAQQWTVRDGVSVAGCTYVDRLSLSLRFTSAWGVADAGMYC